jgi:hypothetical protein
MSQVRDTRKTKRSIIFVMRWSFTSLHRSRRLHPRDNRLVETLNQSAKPTKNISSPQQLWVQGISKNNRARKASDINQEHDRHGTARGSKRLRSKAYWFLANICRPSGACQFIACPCYPGELPLLLTKRRIWVKDELKGRYFRYSHCVTEARLRVTKPQLRFTKAKLRVTEPTLRCTEARLRVTKPQLRFTKAKLRVTEPTLRCTEAKLRATGAKLRVTEGRLKREPSLNVTHLCAR